MFLKYYLDRFECREWSESKFCFFVVGSGVVWVVRVFRKLDSFV